MTALELFNQALAKAEASRDLAGQARVLNNIASVYRYQSWGDGSGAPDRMEPPDRTMEQGLFQSNLPFGMGELLLGLEESQRR